MPVYIIPKEKQADGQFNGGAILEKKPIGFPQDGGEQRPYSNLFYWAHAFTDGGSLIGEHPHQGFEILTFVLKGDIEHYDSKQKGWTKLKEGDMQIIRAGNGITHAEKMNAGSQMIQIWFDPGLENTLGKPATYNDYRKEEMPVVMSNGYMSRVYVGTESPLLIDSPGLTIADTEFNYKMHSWKLREDEIFSAFIIEGQVDIEGHTLASGDFFRVEEKDKITFKTEEKTRLFYIKSPAKLPYKTYSELQGI